MPTPKKTGTAPKRSSTAAKTRSTSTKATAPAAYATKVKPVRTIPTGPVTHSKTLANGQPRPKKRG